MLSAIYIADPSIPRLRSIDEIYKRSETFYIGPQKNWSSRLVCPRVGSIPVHAAVKSWAWLSENPTLLVHAASGPITMRLAVLARCANRLKVLPAVSANAFLEFRHVSFSIHTHLNVDVPLV